MTCFNHCCPHFHRSTALAQTDGNLIVTVSNSTNIASKDRFCFVLCQRPSTVVTGDPIPVQMNINGVNVPVYNKYAIQMTSRELESFYRCRRLPLCGFYVVNGENSYIIFNEVPRTCGCR